MGQSRLGPGWPWIRATAVMMVFIAIVSGAALRTRRVVTSLKSSNAADSDPDWNHVNDFWCGMAELYRMTSAAPRPEPGDEVRLIERSLEESEK